MTSANDRRHRIQRYPKPLVIQAINDTIYGEDNVRIVTNLFVGNLTHRQVAGMEKMDERTLYKRLDHIMPTMEDYLHKLN